MATAMVTALLYSRVSSDEQATEGLSLPTQLAACRRYAAERGWILGGEYQDILSGTRDDRPGYRAMLTEARRLRKDERPAAIVVARLDRFGRRLLERVERRQELAALGVETHSVREGGLVSDLTANVLAVVAQEEVERLGARVRDSREHNAANGWTTPGRVAWGYKLRPATPAERATGAPRSVLVPDDATAPYAAELFRLVASGETTVRGAAKWAASLSPEARGGRRLDYSGIRRLLRAPVYVARPEHGEGPVLGRPRGHWPPLVTDETWQAAQERMDGHQRVPRQASGKHLLTGLLYCECGARMSGWTQGRGKWGRYRCASFMRGGEAAVLDCMASASARPLEAAVMDRVTALVSTVADADPKLRAALSRAWERLRHPDAQADRDRRRMLAQAEQAAEKSRKRLGDAARLLVDGALDRAGYEALRDAESAALEAADRERARLAAETPQAGPTLPPLGEVLAEVGGWAEALRGADVPAQREVLAALLERVAPVRTGYGKYQARITWSPLGQALEALTTNA